MTERIISDEEKLFPEEKVYESEFFTASQDWEVAIPGFYIVTPKRRVKTILDLSDEETLDFIGTIKQVRKAMLEVLGIKDVYYFQNEDTPLQFHLWMLPYCDWMEGVAGRGPGILLQVWEYAKENLNTPEAIKETKDAARKMREYFEKRKSL
ncbi:diadenosine tetraphosphate hydrolase [Candidatus Woesearchaeota archaeon]|nr:diadenosine tetraphosphate hydrolase [Candidatus Woesearchaeota archaeon]